MGGNQPLRRGSKISEEDPPPWIKDSKIGTGGSEENLKTWEKTHCFIKLKSKYKVFHKGLYIMGQNSKKPNTTNNPICPNKYITKNYKKSSDEFKFLPSFNI